MTDFYIPLGGSYNTRVTTANQLSSASGIVGSGIVGIMVVGAGSSTPTKDQRFINCFTERVVNPYTNKATLYLVKRPGFAAIFTPAGSVIGNDIFIWTGNSSKIISAFGATNSTLYDTTTSLGAITGLATGLTETIVGTTATVVTASTDSTAWYYDTGVGVSTKITDVDFPGNAGKTLAGNFSHMDGFAFIMDSTGAVWNSDLNSVTAWTANSFISANSYPDKGVGCVRHKDKIVAFGSESTQFFYNAGLTPSPLARNEPLTLKIGCVGYAAITNIDNAVYWAGSSAQGGLGVYKYGDTFQRISIPEVESILIISGAGNITLSSIKFYGRSFVIVQASTVTFVYCVEENAWHEWSSTTPLWSRCAGVSTGGSQVNYAISKIATTGKVYTINPASLTFQDDSVAYSATIQTSKLGDGIHRTFWNDVNIIGDRETSASSLTVSVSDDDYQNSTILGTVDLSDLRPGLNRCGSAYRRSWILTHSANTPMRIEALAGSQTVGTG